MNIRRQTLAASQSRNPRFHSNGVLKLGRVSRSIPQSEWNTQGGITFCPEIPVSTESRTRVRQTPVYNTVQKLGSNRCSVAAELEGESRPGHGRSGTTDSFLLSRYNSDIFMVLLIAIANVLDDLTSRWHTDPNAGSGNDFEALVIEQHRQNFALWHEEDRARAPLASPEEIAQTKRNIDVLNQVRNDLVEAIDRELLQQLQSDGVKIAGELHSETPGMIIEIGRAHV